MAKQIIILLLIPTYLLASTGIWYNKHYCLGNLASTSFIFKAKNPCACNDEDESDACCKNEVKLCKVKADQLTQKADIVHFNASIIELSTPVSVQEAQQIQAVTKVFLPQKIPPERTAIFIKNKAILV